MSLNRLGMLTEPDLARAERRDSFACGSCGSPEPARIDGTTCSDCTEYARCYLCRRWTFEEQGSGVLVTFEGAVRCVCESCWSKGDVEVPLSYEEDDGD